MGLVSDFCVRASPIHDIELYEARKMKKKKLESGSNNFEMIIVCASYVFQEFLKISILSYKSFTNDIAFMRKRIECGLHSYDFQRYN